MMIDDTKYLLDEKNYYDTEFEKRQIVLANTFSEKDKHINGWMPTLMALPTVKTPSH